MTIDPGQNDVPTPASDHPRFLLALASAYAEGFGELDAGPHHVHELDGRRGAVVVKLDEVLLVADLEPPADEEVAVRVMLLQRLPEHAIERGRDRRRERPGPAPPARIAIGQGRRQEPRDRRRQQVQRRRPGIDADARDRTQGERHDRRD